MPCAIKASEVDEFLARVQLGTQVRYTRRPDWYMATGDPTGQVRAFDLNGAWCGNGRTIFTSTVRRGLIDGSLEVVDAV